MTIARMAHRSYPDLETWRRAQGLSQAAAAAKFGITQGGWSKIVLGRTRPRPDLMRRLLAETGVPLEILAGVA